MEGRSGSNDHLPEVHHTGFAAQNPYEDYEFYERPPAPVPEYQQYAESPALSQSGGSPRITSERASSPPVQDHLQIGPDGTPKDRPLSPSSTARYSEVNSPGLQSVYEKEGEKEVIRHQSQPIYVQGPRSHDEEHPRKSRICGLSKLWFFGLAALVLIAIIAIAVACGVVFGTKHSNSSPASTPSPTSSAKPSPTSTSSSVPTPTGDPDITIGGAMSPLYYSKTGAFNGSGIAIASVNFGQDASIFVFFQHYTGEIRSFIQEADGTWTDSNVVVSSGAKNGTPISAVAYLVEEVATWHVFYIDTDSRVRQRINSNSSAYQTNIWKDGPLNDLELTANDADMVGLQACYWGNFYGDSDYTFANGFNATNTNTTIAPTGMHLWYADSDTTFQQYSWYTGQTQWSNDNHTWHNMNGHAGVGCQTWDSGTVQYVFFVDVENTMEIWWKDSNSTNETPDHPTNLWVNTTVSVPNVHSSSSLGYTNYLTLQYGDETIRGYNISWAAENTTIAPAKDGGPGYDEWKIPDVTGIPGTHLSITALADTSGGAHLAIFFQQNGTDVVQFTRDNSLGAFASSQVPVNQ